jgi:hypothetical protein
VTQGWRTDRNSRFYRLAALAALGVALTGFFLTYLRPMALGSFSGPGWSHVHGATLLAWLLLTIAQTQLVGRSLALHRRLGWAALLIAPAMMLTTVAIGVQGTARGVESGGGPEVISGLIGSITAPLMFLVLVSAALIMRRDPQWHKRLIFVATVAMLWPAWFRWRHFLPWIPRPDITLGLVIADLPIALAMVRDRWRFGAVHPAYLWAGIPLAAEQVFEVFAFDTAPWRKLAQLLYAALA